MKEDDDYALLIFDTKKEAVGFGRDYLRKHGGALRIWMSDGTSLQEQLTYEKKIEGSSFYSGILEGLNVTTKVAGQLIPAVRFFVSKGFYQAGFYTSYCVVFSASMLARLIPIPNPLALGVHDGAKAALNSTEKTHYNIKVKSDASCTTQVRGGAKRIALRII